MKKDQYWSKPKKANVVRGSVDAWWYASEGSIEIHVDIRKPYDHAVLRMKRSDLRRYMEKSAR